MAFAQAVETSVSVISNSPSQDYTHPDDRDLLNYDLYTAHNYHKVLWQFIIIFLLDEIRRQLVMAPLAADLCLTPDYFTRQLGGIPSIKGGGWFE